MRCSNAPVPEAALPPEAPLPRELAPLLGFCQVLRRQGFAVSTDQAMGFIEAVRWLGPRSIESLRHAAHAMLAPRPERVPAFEQLFRQHFYGEGSASSAGQDDRLRELEPDSGGAEPERQSLQADRGGEHASPDELLAARRFEPTRTGALGRLTSEWPRRLPQRRGFRRQPAPRGAIALRRSLKAMARSDGDVSELHLVARRPTPRRTVVLIDISGSMKEHTPIYLRIAHVLVRTSPKIEVFTVGTRLTNITRALRASDAERALQAVAAQVADWDGGTRIGPAIDSLLRSTRYAAFVRGALVLALSDGLECGDPAALVQAVQQIARRCWRLVWASPLVADPSYQPRTAAMRAMRPSLDALIDGSAIEPIVAHLLGLSASVPPTVSPPDGPATAAPSHSLSTTT